MGLPWSEDRAVDAADLIAGVTVTAEAPAVRVQVIGFVAALRAWRRRRVRLTQIATTAVATIRERHLIDGIATATLGALHKRSVPHHRPPAPRATSSAAAYSLAVMAVLESSPSHVQQKRPSR